MVVVFRCCYLPLAVVVWASLTTYLVGCTPLDPAVQATNGASLHLTPFIKHHAPAHYDASALRAQHQRVRRSLRTPAQPVRLDVRTHGRLFRLRLRVDSNLFANDIEFHSTEGPVHFDTSSVYTGTLEDDDTAIVRGIITSEGLFDGTISTQLEDLYIEPVSRYLGPSNTSTLYHSIAYRTADVQVPKQAQACGLCSGVAKQRDKRWVYEKDKELIKRNRNHGILFADSNYPANTDDHIKNEKNKTRVLSWNNEGQTLFDLETGPVDLVDELIDDNAPMGGELFDMGAMMSQEEYNGSDYEHLHRKRAVIVDPSKTTCMLYLQADHPFYQKYGSEEACIEVMTRHVQRVNDIYRSTDFNQDGRPDNITFMIKRIKVHTMEALKNPKYRFPNNYGVEKFLEIFSEEDYDAFCLAYMFTYRDFEMGTLGLAWTGDLKNAGGVCEKNGHYRGSMKSLNTGIVTLLNYGKHVPPAVSHVTLAHEIGHNFGSPHDPETCTPGGEDGNYIMFARATSGDKKNNNNFSPCSLRSINPVLNYKARSTKGCFTEPQVALCGNGVVEEGEECDCGWEDDCHDQCCFPQRRHPPSDAPPCRLTPQSICSPSQGPCCTSSCELKFGNKCREDNGCRVTSFCNGKNAQCPPSINKPNKTICNEDFVCFMGECTGSICLAYGLESCQCIPGPSDPKTKACELCCKLPGEGQPCLSSFEWNEAPYDVPDKYSKPGTPCNDYNGYCDVFQKCREVDPSGPLATLRKLLLSDESIASFKKWVMDYWYVVALIIMTLIVLLILSTKYLGKRQISKLKSVTIIHSPTTETVRLPTETDTGQVTVHPAVRSKLPLKQKVRNGKKRRARRQKDKPSLNNNVSPKKAKSILHKRKSSTKPGAEKRVSKDLDNAHSKVKKLNNKVAPSNNKKQKAEVVHKEVKGMLNPESPVSPGYDADPVGKVQNWLLKSQLPVVIPKSKSSPAGLTERGGRSPHKSRALRPSGDKSRSVGHLPVDKDKVRLQVIYKPPFKFSVKLRKADKSSVVVDRSGQRVSDRSGANKQAGQRAGLLVRSVRQRQTDRPVTNAITPTQAVPQQNNTTTDDIDSNIHTVQSDLEVLLSESEFLFSNE